MNGIIASGVHTTSATGGIRSPPLLKRKLEDSLSMMLRGPRHSEVVCKTTSELKAGLSLTGQIKFKKKPSAEESQQLKGSLRGDSSSISKKYQSQVEIGFAKHPSLL